MQVSIIRREVMTTLVLLQWRVRQSDDSLMAVNISENVEVNGGHQVARSLATSRQKAVYDPGGSAWCGMGRGGEGVKHTQAEQSRSNGGRSREQRQKRLKMLKKEDFLEKGICVLIFKKK